VDTLTSAEKAIAARRLAAMRPVVAVLAGMAAPDGFWELCRDELSGVDVATGGWPHLGLGVGQGPFGEVVSRGCLEGSPGEVQCLGHVVGVDRGHDDAPDVVAAPAHLAVYV
jgi:hypothetical protein